MWQGEAQIIHLTAGDTDYFWSCPDSACLENEKSAFPYKQNAKINIPTTISKRLCL